MLILLLILMPIFWLIWCPLWSYFFDIGSRQLNVGIWLLIDFFWFFWIPVRFVVLCLCLKTTTNWPQFLHTQLFNPKTLLTYTDPLKWQHFKHWSSEVTALHRIFLTYTDFLTWEHFTESFLTWIDPIKSEYRDKNTRNNNITETIWLKFWTDSIQSRNFSGPHPKAPPRHQVAALSSQGLFTIGSEYFWPHLRPVSSAQSYLS